MELSYQEVYTMNKAQARYQLVQTYLQTGSLARTAQLWQTSRAVVRRQRLRRLLWHREGLALSPNTIRHILRRHGLVQPRRKRKPCYPAHWAEAGGAVGILLQRGARA